jgi:hypothetical protein
MRSGVDALPVHSPDLHVQLPLTAVGSDLAFLIERQRDLRGVRPEQRPPRRLRAADGGHAMHVQRSCFTETISVWAWTGVDPS